MFQDYRWLVGVLLVCAGVLSAQEDRPDEPSKAGEPPLTVPRDVKVARTLDAAEDFLKEKDWHDAVRALQSILAREDVFLERKVKDKDGRESVQWLSARAEANRLLDSLPREGREAYETAFAAKAAERLAEAKTKKNDPELLADVLRHYSRTRAGAEAADLLAAHYLKSDQPDLALRCLEAALDRPGEDPVPAVLFRAALAHRRLGHAERAEPIEKKLFAKVGKGGLTLDGEVLTVDAVRKQLDAAKARAEAPLKDWPMFRGNARRDASGAGDVPFLDEDTKWVQPMIRQDQTRTWVDQAVKAQEERRQEAVLPAFFPVAVRRKEKNHFGERVPTVFFRSYLGVHGVDLNDGKLVWEQDLDYSVDTLVNNRRGGGKLIQIQQWLPSYQQTGNLNLLYENSTLGTLTTDGKLLFTIDDLALPPHPLWLNNFMWGGQPNYGPLTDAMHHSRLLALSLDSGKRMWQAGGGDEKADKVANTFFLGAPLPLGGKLYIAAEKNSEMKLLCLNATDGSLQWSQTLANLRDAIPRDVGRRAQAVNLAYGNGILVCPTNAGAVFGVDLLTRRLVWAHRYTRPAPAQPANPKLPQRFQLGGDIATTAFRCSAPVIQDGRVVVTAPDGDDIRCLNLRDGSLVWQQPRKGDLYLAGVCFQGKVLLVGKESCRALNLADGKPLWTLDTGVPSGMGVATEGTYLLPLSKAAGSKEAEICVIDLKKGEIRSHVRSRRNEKPGNLLLYEGRVISQTVRELTGYPSLRAKLQSVDDALKLNPKDPAGLVERAELLLATGEHLRATQDLVAALAEKPDEKVRALARHKLHEALTELLQRDFQAGEKYLDQYEELCRVPIPNDAAPEERKKLKAEEQRRRATALAILAAGRERQGKPEEALKYYLEFAGLGEATRLLAAPDDARTQVCPEVWSRGRIAALLAKAGPEQAKALEKIIAKRWEDVAKKDDIDSLRAFVAALGTSTAAGREATLRLAETLAEKREFGEAELLLLRLRASGDEASAARATDRLAGLLMQKGLAEDTAHWLRVLDRDFGKVIVRDRKTGADILNDASTDKRLLAFLSAPPELWSGKIRQRETFGQFKQLQMTYYFEPEGAVPPSLAHDRLALNLNPRKLKLVDRSVDEERWSQNLLNINNNHLQYLNWNQYNPNEKAVRFSYPVQGHIAVFQLATNVYGLDLAARKILWEKSLLGDEKLPIAQIIPDKLGRLNAMFPDNRTEPLGGTSFFTPECVVLRTRQGLMALDPIRGSVLWQKAEVPATTQVFGDDENLYLIDARNDGTFGVGRALRARDGAVVKIPDFASVYANCVATFGRRLLVAEKGPKEEQVLRLYDPLSGKDVWKREFSKGALVLQSEEPGLVGVAEPNDEGKLTIFDGLTQQVQCSIKLDPKSLDKARSIALLADRNNFYVAVNGGAANPWGGPWPALTNGTRGIPVNGRFYTIRRTFERGPGFLNLYHKKWWVDLEDQILILDQFRDLPIALFAARSQKQMNGGVFQSTSVQTVEKATGRVLYDKRQQNNNIQYHTLHVDSRAGTIDLIGYVITVQHYLEAKDRGKE
jgi:outer membrane protein assembly factor BamB